MRRIGQQDAVFEKIDPNERSLDLLRFTKERA